MTGDAPRGSFPTLVEILLDLRHDIEAALDGPNRETLRAAAEALAAAGGDGPYRRHIPNPTLQQKTLLRIDAAHWTDREAEAGRRLLLEMWSEVHQAIARLAFPEPWPGTAAARRNSAASETAALHEENRLLQERIALLKAENAAFSAQMLEAQGRAQLREDAASELLRDRIQSLKQCEETTSRLEAELMQCRQERDAARIKARDAYLDGMLSHPGLQPPAPDKPGR